MQWVACRVGHNRKVITLTLHRTHCFQSLMKSEKWNSFLILTITLRTVCCFFSINASRQEQSKTEMWSLRKNWWSFIWAASSEFVSSSIPSWQILTAHAQSFRGARDLAFCLKVPLDSLLVWPPKPVYDGNFSHEAVTLKIRSRSPKSNKLLILSDLYRLAKDLLQLCVAMCLRKKVIFKGE